MTKRTVEFTKSFKQPTEKVWQFLTEQEKLSRWFLPNNFSLTEKNDFKLWTTPTNSWDGVLHGKINDYEENKSLSYELKTSISIDSSLIDWKIKKDKECSHLNLSHEGSEILIDTIYKAINGMQVSGHINREKLKQEASQSASPSNDNIDNALLDSLRIHLLHDPENIERAVTQTILKYPSFLDQIIRVAVDTYPEQGIKILNAAKSASGPSLQRLLGLTLFLFLFKDIIHEAQASESTIGKRAAGDKEGHEDEESDRESDEILHDLKTDLSSANIRAAFAFTTAIMFLIKSDPVEANIFANSIIKSATLGSIVKIEETSSEEGGDLDETNELLSFATELSNLIEEPPLQLEGEALLEQSVSIDFSILPKVSILDFTQLTLQNNPHEQFVIDSQLDAFDSNLNALQVFDDQTLTLGEREDEYGEFDELFDEDEDFYEEYESYYEFYDELSEDDESEYYDYIDVKDFADHDENDEIYAEEKDLKSQNNNHENHDSDGEIEYDEADIAEFEENLVFFLEHENIDPISDDFAFVLFETYMAEKEAFHESQPHDDLLETESYRTIAYLENVFSELAPA